jgi:hypothetical protein
MFVGVWYFGAKVVIALKSRGIIANRSTEFKALLEGVGRRIAFSRVVWTSQELIDVDLTTRRNPLGTKEIKIDSNFNPCK